MAFMDTWTNWFFSTSFGQFFSFQNLSFILPEVAVLFTLMLCIASVLSSKAQTAQTSVPGLKQVVSFFNMIEEERLRTWTLAIMGVTAAFTLMLSELTFLYPEAGINLGMSTSVLGGIFQADLFSWLIRFFLLLGTLVVLLFCRKYIEQNSPVSGEFYIVLMGALLGAMFMVGANDLLMLFVGLETLGISSYILVGYARGDARSGEACLKYLLYGAVCTAVLLFGFSLLYALAGGYTDYPHLVAALGQPSVLPPFVFVIATVLVLAGFAFKLSAAPFHMWTPDVYEGAPTPVTAFLSIVSKTAGFAVVIRLLYGVLGDSLGATWFGLIATLAVLSMTVGNFVALTQRNIKRLLAYSTIAHAGYILLGFVLLGQERILTEAGIGAMVYYLMTYLFMNLGAFAAVIYFSNQGGSEEISDYAGLVQKRPWLTLMLCFFLLSLAGIPITAGFFAKFFLFQAVASAGSQYLWLVVVALLNSTVSLYYYMNVIRLMVVADPSDAVKKLDDPNQGRLLSPIGVALQFCFVGTLILGIIAGPMLEFSKYSVSLMASGARGAEQFISFLNR